MNKNMDNLLLVLIAFSSFLSLSAGEVETATYCDTLTFGSPNWNDNHTLPLFDPSLGNLVGVDMAVDLSVFQNFSLENEVQEGQLVGADSEAGFLITMPNSSTISVNASSSVSEELAAYDGDTDFSGPSGRKIEGVESKGSAEERYLELSDFIASFQNETVSLPAAVSIRSGTSANSVFSLSTIAESKVCVTYTYEPGGSGEKGDCQ